MAIIAERNTVGNVVAKVNMGCEGFNMMGMQNDSLADILARSCAALLACVVVSREYCLSPFFVRWHFASPSVRVRLVDVILKTLTLSGAQRLTVLLPSSKRAWPRAHFSDGSPLFVLGHVGVALRALRRDLLALHADLVIHFGGGGSLFADATHDADFPKRSIAASGASDAAFTCCLPVSPNCGREVSAVETGPVGGTLTRAADAVVCFISAHPTYKGEFSHAVSIPKLPPLVRGTA